jgi:cytochrome c oxidase subunit 1
MIGGFGSIATAANIITTIFCMRCRGMTLAKMPLLVWLNLIMCGMVLIAVSPLTAAQIMLLLDRFAGSHFFDTQAGGSATLWMHFFWIFGHPEVYVLIIPAFAFASEIIPVFSRKAIFGYPVMVGATLAIAFVSLSVWAHHMFTIGMTSTSNTFFAVFDNDGRYSDGHQNLQLAGNDVGGNCALTPQCCSASLSCFQFLIAGLTGIMLAAAPFNWQLNDSYFVIAHFHFVLVGVDFHDLRGCLLLVPKATGRLLSERLGKWHFWLFLIGFHMTFDTMHIPGILGMPRRIYTYEAGRGWGTWNLICTIGVAFQVIGTLIFVLNILLSLRKGRPAGNDPWDAWTLEWSTSSPSPEYNFAEIPTVKSRRPLWDIKHPSDPDWKYE